MRTNLSSQISLNRVSPKYYKPENAVERSVLTRCEKVPTDIYETMEEGVQHIANEITAKIQERQREGKFCVIGAGTGASLRPLYAELVRKHKDEGLSFRNVVIFNLYEYYPLASEGAGSSFSQLNDLFLSQIDIDKQNVFTIDGTIPQEAVIEYCRLYEQRIQTFGGIDIVLMGIGAHQSAFNIFFRRYLNVPPMIFLIAISVSCRSCSISFRYIRSFLRQSVSISTTRLCVSLSGTSICSSIMVPSFTTRWVVPLSILRIFS